MQVAGTALRASRVSWPRPGRVPGTLAFRSQPKQHARRLSIRPKCAAGVDVVTAAQGLFEELKPVFGIEADSIKIAQTQDGIGLVATKLIMPDEVFFKMGLRQCIVYDIEGNALWLPDGCKPGPMVTRMQELMAEDLQPWDNVMSFAIMDALEGHFGKAWHDLAQVALSSPDEGAQPYLLSPELQDALGDPVLIQEAREQRELLAEEFPDLMVEPTPGELPLFLRVFAYVNSHTYCLGGNVYTLVPFMDFANHSNIPNALIKSDPDEGTAMLQAFYPLKEGERVLVNFFAEWNVTNQRFMLQYGFVPPGNVGERLEFDGVQSTAALSSKRLQPLIEDLVEYRKGFWADQYLYQAVNSLPMDEDKEDGDEGHMDTAAECLKISEGWLKEIPGTAEEDEAELATLEESPRSRRGAVLRYRVERRRAVEAAIKVLEAYLEAP
eukprot:jgi/Botrbrau1/8796/Bobra.0330s0027.1